MREPLFRAALLRFAGPVPVSLKWAELTDPTLRGRLSLPWPVGAGFSPGPLGDSLLAVKSPCPLPVQTETMSPDSRKPGGLPRPTSPAHRTGFFQHLPGANCGPAVQGLKWRSCSQVLTRLLPGSPRSLIFFLLWMAQITRLFWNTAGKTSLLLVRFVHILCRVFFF